MIGLLEGIRGGASDARAAEQLRMQREQAARQQMMQDMQLTQMRRAMEREDRTQGDIDAAIAAWGDEGAASPVGLAPPRNMNAPVGLEPPEPMAAPPGAPPGMPGAAPTGGLSKFDRAVGTAALRSGNFDAAYKLKDRVKAENQDAGRKAEFKRLMGLSSEELTAAFAPMNMSGEFKAMVKFDPKTGRYMVASDVKGLDSGTHTKAELVQSMMSVWEAGNGNFEKGLAGMLAAEQSRRALADKDYERSFGLAKAEADVHFKTADDERAAARDAATAKYQNATLGLQRDRLNRDKANAPAELSPDTLRAFMEMEQKWIQADPKDRPAIERQYQLLQSRAGYEMRRPLGLPSKGPQGAKAMTELERAQAYKAYVDGGMPPELAQARVNGVDVDAMIAGAVQRKLDEKNKGNGRPTQVTAQQAPAKPEVTYETMPLSALQGYTSPEARAVYQRRLAEQQRLSAQPRFWLGNREAAEPPMLGGF